MRTVVAPSMLGVEPQAPSEVYHPHHPTFCCSDDCFDIVNTMKQKVMSKVMARTHDVLAPNEATRSGGMARACRGGSFAKTEKVQLDRKVRRNFDDSGLLVNTMRVSASPIAYGRKFGK